MTRVVRSWLAVWVTTVIVVTGEIAPLSAQELPPATATDSRLPTVGVSPRGAFLRAIALPGWGHAAIGSYTRGGFYFAFQTANAYMFLRTRARLSEARSRLAFRETALRAQLMAEGITDPVALEDAIDLDQGVLSLRSLEDSRRDQQEDVVALGIFLFFLSGADAYVSAHLSRFPEPLDFQAEPVGDGRFEVTLKVKLPN